MRTKPLHRDTDYKITLSKSYLHVTKTYHSMCIFFSIRQTAKHQNIWCIEIFQESMAYDIIIMYFPISMLSKTYDLKRAPHVSKFSYTNSVMGYSRRMSCMVSTHGKSFKNVTKLKSSNKSFINFAFSKSRLQMMVCKCQLYSKDSSKSSILKSDTNNCVLFHLILKHLGQ